MKIWLVVGIGMLQAFGLKAWASAEAEFWQWFNSNEARLFEVEGTQGNVFDALSAALTKVHPDLTFEFGPKESGRREFILSAGGTRQAFPVVSALVKAAPELPRWKIVAFRPRRNVLSIVTLGGVTLSPHDVRFTYQTEGDRLGVTLYIKGYNPARRGAYANAGYFLLDELLGEYDAETRISYIEFRDAAASSRLTKLPLLELPAVVDRLPPTKSRD